MAVDDDAWLAELRAHDAHLQEAGHPVWVGGEPTFTDRFSGDAPWVSTALGGDKLSRAERIVQELARRYPGAAVLRTLGRQYPEEELPRWSLGLYRLRSGDPVWDGPPDPCVAQFDVATIPPSSHLRDLVADALGRTGWFVQRVEVGGSLPHRLVYSPSEFAPLRPEAEPELRRGPLAETPVEPAGAWDPLVDRGQFLLSFGHRPNGGLTVELPQLSEVEAFIELLRVLGPAAREAGVPTLVLGGFGPPVDAQVSFATVTPDPAVVEINMAPSPSAADFAFQIREQYEVAAAAGLQPLRLHYNGTVADSGGGGHLTLGGETRDASIFLRHPELLPRLVAYLVRHPALSYLFSDHAGASSQAPRVDEGPTECFEELKLAVALLDTARPHEPELLWESLAPFLVDRFGNTHRSEINIEKLANPLLPGRGQLGVVEFRALRMPSHPRRWEALVVLFRSIVARLVNRPASVELVDWGATLHDRYSLPFFQDLDLRDVFKDLQEQGFPVASAFQEELLDQSHRELRAIELPGTRVELHHALEFFPLIGDLSAQNQTSRLIDPSCARLQLLLRTFDGAPWNLSVDGVRVPFVDVRDTQGRALLRGLRFRSFVPSARLHPLVEARDPLHLRFTHPIHDPRIVRVHSWHPEGQAYPGLPEDSADAQARRRARVTVQRAGRSDAEPGLSDPPAEALSEFFVDLRRVPVPSRSELPA
ncbi:MAG: transglutaminase family protein [Myxococcota bacterium]